VTRRRRFDEEGGYYHVTQGGLDGAPLFRNDDDRSFFLSFLGRVTLRDHWRCFSYCLMSTHYHLVVQRMSVSLAQSVGWLSGVYARAFNGRHARTGHVFGARYRVAVITDEQHLVEACRYVELNPVRAGICADPADWTWSSYRAHAGLCPRPQFLSSEAVRLVGGDWTAFVAQAPRDKKSS
jgi:REP element-mobilizing transposase RayT